MAAAQDEHRGRVGVGARPGPNADAGLAEGAAPAVGAKGLASESLSWKLNVGTQVVFYIVALCSFYGYLLPKLANEVTIRCTKFHKCERHIGRAPLGYNTDLSDSQWSTFRRQLPYLVLGLGLMATSHYVVRRFLGHVKIAKGSIPISSLFHFIVGTFLIIVLHGLYTVVIVSLAVVSFYIGTLFRGSMLNPLLTWALGLSIIVMKESYRAPNSSLGQLTAPLFFSGYGGLYPWKFAANFLILRLVSFNMDLFWASRQHDFNKKEKKTDVSPPDTSVSNHLANEMHYTSSGSHYKSIVTQHRPMSQYNIVNFLAYIMYAPLYIAGPILPFNAFVAQMEKPQTVKSPTGVVFYGLRWITWFFLMEVLTHFYPFFAVTNSGLFRGLSPPQMAATAYVALKLMWLKFLLLWRFFQMWAWIDGVETVENMPRCMSNNYSLREFWRRWHSSFNEWLVRYIYVPMGGRNNRFLSVWVIFLFVALWHDAEVKLVAWGLLNSVFFVVEDQCIALVFRPNMRWFTQAWYFPLIQSAAAGVYIIVLVGVNLIGYSVGVLGAWSIVKKFMSDEGLVTMWVSLAYMMVGAMIMFFLRRRGWCAP